MASVSKIKTAPKPEAPSPSKRVMTADELLLWPEAQAAAGLDAWASQFGKVDANELVPKLVAVTKAISNGDLRHVEAMLIGQAEVLQSMFVSLARRASTQTYLPQFQTYATLALKAQAQSRATLVALAEIKNPRQVQFVGQANIAQGPQQVNNAIGTPMPAGAEKKATVQNELLEAPNERLDTRAQGPTGQGHSVLEAVGASNGTEHG